MPVNVWIDQKNGLVHADLDGVVAIDTFLKLLEGALSSPEFRTGMGILMDTRAATHHMESGDMAKVARYLSENHTRIVGGKAAIVVGQTVTYGMVRMLQARVDAMPFGFSIFYDMAEAQSWLGLPREDMSGANVRSARVDAAGTI